jgi:hypothetical protein
MTHSEAIAIVAVFSKATAKTPHRDIDACKRRLQEFGEHVPRVGDILNPEAGRALVLVDSEHVTAELLGQRGKLA